MRISWRLRPSSVVRPSVAALVALVCAATSLQAEPRRLTILHTNDIQSRLLGFAPNSEYTPLTTGDDDTIGGIARLATLIHERRAKAPEQTLLLDGGDIMMGTLFQALGPTDGTEFRLLHALGYDGATLGNHEFDFGPGGLADTVHAAKAAGPLPPLMLANIAFDPDDPADDALAALFEDGTLTDRRLIERGGVQVGLFGILGAEALELTAYAPPVTFPGPIEVARRTAAQLRAEGADIVICLSHSGVHHQGDGTWDGEDAEYLRQIPDIDVVIGGHSHTPLFEPVMVGDRPAVQAGSEARYLGVLELEVDNGVKVVDYELVPIDDSIPGDPTIHEKVLGFQQRIDETILAPFGLTFEEPLLHTSFDLELDADDLPSSNLGHFVADALRFAARRDGQPVDLAVINRGFVRDTVRTGRTGQQQLSDLYRLLPLGIGTVDDDPGYAMVRVWMYGHELKAVTETMIFAWRTQGSRYFPFFSGARVTFNAWRPPLDKIYDIQMEQDDGTFVPMENDKLYAIALDTYTLLSFPMIRDLSHGIVEIFPKDADGQRTDTIEPLLIDRDPDAPGVQELKEWMAVMDFARQLPDTDGNGIPEVPEAYRNPGPRLIADACLYPHKYLGRGTWIVWGTVLVPTALVALVGIVLWRRRRRG